MLEGKCEENRVPKNVELTPQKKIEVSKSKTKIIKKGTKGNGEPKENDKER